MSTVIVNQTITADGYAAGIDQTEERPFGQDGGDGWGDRLHAWMFDQGDENRAEADQMAGARAHIMGRNMFGPVRGEWDRDWNGWWGDNPPFHAPVFVLSHHAREPQLMEGGTIYHFVTDGIESALAQAREAAGDGEISIQGGADTINQYLAAGLVDELRLHILGEEGVRTCTLTDLVPEGTEAAREADRRIALLKGDGRMPGAVEAAIRLSERPPSRPTVLDTPWGELSIGQREWVEALGAADPAAPHNDARAEIWEALLDILVAILSTRTGESEAVRHGRWSAEGWGDAGWRDAGWDDDAPRRGFDDEEEFDAYGLSGGRADADAIRRSLTADTDLPTVFDTVWPLLDPAAIVRSLWTFPALLLRCAPWLTAEQAALLQRSPSGPWTVSDFPLLDAALQRAGDPERDRRRHTEAARAAADRAVMDEVIHDLIATDDSDLKTMSMLRGQDLRAALDTYTGPAASSTDLLAGPFAHIIVDEAQELTPAEWAMITRRVPSRSLTVVGDRAQARRGFPESWTERLAEVGSPGATVATLSVNYRTPVAVMEQAEPVIRAVLPDANVPRSIRDNGIPVRHAPATDRDRIFRAWLDAHPEGTACVIGDDAFAGMPRVRSLSAAEAKGLEFDLVLLVEPGPRHGGTTPDRAAAIEAAVDRYVAMTRTTGELVILDPTEC